MVPAEEAHLEVRFGDNYRNYCGRTRRFWPHFSNFRSPEFLRIELKRLGMEVVRLRRAALLSVALVLVVSLRMAEWWPRWLHLP